MARKVGLVKDQYALGKRLLKGRQVLKMIYERYVVPDEEVSIMDFQNLLDVRLIGDDLKTFMHEWDSVLLGMTNHPDVSILETLFRNQVEHHPGIREHMAHYKRCPVGHADRNYDFLTRIVKQ